MRNILAILTAIIVGIQISTETLYAQMAEEDIIVKWEDVISAKEKAGREMRDSALRYEAKRANHRNETLADRITDCYIEGLRYKEQWTTDNNGITEINNALESFNHSLELQDSNNIPYPETYAACFYHMSDIYISLRRANEAFYCADKAHKYSPDNEQYAATLGWLYSHGNTIALKEKAIKIYEILSKKYPKNSVYHLDLVQLYAEVGKPNKAFKQIKIYEKENEESLMTLTYKLNILYGSGKSKQAMKEIDDFAEKNPIEKENALIMKERLAGMIGDNLLRIETLENIIAENPYNVDALIDIADCYKSEDNYEMFEEYTKRAIETGKLRLETMEMNARLTPLVINKLEKGDTAEAYSILDTIQNIYRNDLNVAIYTYNVVKQLKDTAKMIKALEIISNVEDNVGSEDDQHKRELLSLYFTKQMNDSAISFSERQSEIYKGDDMWKYFVVLALSSDTAHQERVVKKAKEVLVLMKNKFAKSEIYGMLGIAYSKQENSTKSREAYDSALVYNNENALVLNNYAYELATAEEASEEDLARAETMAAKAMRIDSKSAYIIDTYAWVLHLRGDNFAARMYADKLVKASNDSNAEMSIDEMYHIYVIYKATENENAVKWLEKIRKEYNKDPEKVNNKEIKEILK